MERQIKIIPCIYGGKPAEAAKAYDHSGADAVGYYDEKITAETVKEIAKDLVELYAARQEKHGFVYGEDTVWQREFEEMFPFEETEDQLLAIEATKKDMESTKIMDRLICGDGIRQDRDCDPCGI